MSKPVNLDLATITDLRTYLQGTPFESEGITALTGGYGNVTFRLKLKVPYEGHSTLVAKHAKDHVIASGKKIPFSLSRQVFEVEALNRTKDIPSTGQIVTVPKVHLFDKEANVIIMEDCGEGALTLKQFIQEGRSHLSLAEEIGRALGEFIGNLHVWGEHNVSVISLFEGNEQAKSVSAWATYGRLISTLTDKDDLPALQDPPIDISEECLEIIRGLSSERMNAITSARDSFVMGDLWPGNILITLTEYGTLERIYIIDWELAKPGLPALDIGQFCAEMDLLRRFHPECKPSADKTISTFLDTHSGIYRPDISFARMTIVHWGVHLVVWTPRIPWGEKEKTRETVKEGVVMLVEGHSGPEDWVRRWYVDQ